MDSFHLLKTAERVAFRNQFRQRSLVHGAGHEEHYVVNHVAVPARSNEIDIYYLNITNQAILDLGLWFSRDVIQKSR